MKKRILFFGMFISVFSIFLIYFFGGTSFAATPALVTQLENAFQSIEGWILKLATPAAAVAVGTGIFMQKFSFGEEERIRTGKKVVRTSLFAYAFILAVDLILSTINSLI